MDTVRLYATPADTFFHRRWEWIGRFNLEIEGVTGYWTYIRKHDNRFEVSRFVLTGFNPYLLGVARRILPTARCRLIAQEPQSPSGNHVLIF